MSTSPANKVNPNHAPNPVVPSVPEKDLAGAIALAREVLAKHKAARPSNHDISALTVWAQDHGTIETNLNLLESQARMAWKEVPVPTTPPRQPELPPRPQAKPAAVAAAKPAKLPPPIPPPVPAPEVPMPLVAKPAPLQLQHLVIRLQDQIIKMTEATNRPDFVRMRQASYWMRSELVKFAKVNKLEVPALPEVPSDPFSTRGAKPGKVAKMEDGTPEVAHVAPEGAATGGFVADEIHGVLAEFTTPLLSGQSLGQNSFQQLSLMLGDQAGAPGSRGRTLAKALRCLKNLRTGPQDLPALLEVLAEYAERGEAVA